MIHMGCNFSSDQFAEMIEAMAVAIARTMALIEDHDQMHEALEKLCEAMQKDACHHHAFLHKVKEEKAKADGVRFINAEDFLRDIFKPEKFNG